MTASRPVLAPAGALLLTALLLGALPTALAAAVLPEVRPALEAELTLERRMLTRDVAAYAEARTAERREQARVQGAELRLDELIAGNTGALRLDNYERLRAEAAAARGLARSASDQVEEVRRRLSERLRRIAALQDELAGGPRLADPLSGRWRVRVLPQDVSGTFELRLDGTLVSGRYQLDNGLAGSLRGTYVDNAVRLERIDAQDGFDSTFLGAVAAAAGRITGTWHATELAAGAPASGQWSAEKLPPTPR